MLVLVVVAAWLEPAADGTCCRVQRIVASCRAWLNVADAYRSTGIPGRYELVHSAPIAYFGAEKHVKNDTA